MTRVTDSLEWMHFSTDDLPPRERIPMWREAFSRTALKVDVTPRNDESFYANLSVLGLPGIGVSWGQNSAQLSERTRQMVANGDDDLCLIVAAKGDAVLKQIGREAQIGAGTALLVSGAETGTAECSEGFTHLTLKLSRRELYARVPDVEGAIIRSLGTDTEAIRLVCAYSRALWEQVTVRSPELRQLAATHLYDLVAVAVGATRDATEIAHARGIRGARVRDILSEIKSGFADPSISPRNVAAKFRLSTRYVQDLLQETGMSFTERVQEMRLQKARSMLMNPPSDRSTVGEIAYACGFNEVPYFNRCFRRRFGASPTQFRSKGADF